MLTDPDDLADADDLAVLRTPTGDLDQCNAPGQKPLLALR